MILLILTSHRLDCFALCIECLERHTRLSAFERIYVMANAPNPEHLQAAMSFAKRHANAKVVGFGPRGLTAVMEAQTAVLRNHMDSIVVKLDEDVFVAEGWLEGLLQTYSEQASQGCLLVSALVPNNTVGKLMLDANFRERFPTYAMSEELHGKGATRNPAYAVWLWKTFLAGDLELTPENLLQGLATQKIASYLNINCVLMAPPLLEFTLPFGVIIENHTKIMTTDEYKINLAITVQPLSYYGVMTPSSIAHHFSFGGQQEALDATISIADIRARMFGEEMCPSETGEV